MGIWFRFDLEVVDGCQQKEDFGIVFDSEGSCIVTLEGLQVGF